MFAQVCLMISVNLTIRPNRFKTKCLNKFRLSDKSVTFRTSSSDDYHILEEIFIFYVLQQNCSKWVLKQSPEHMN